MKPRQPPPEFGGRCQVRPGTLPGKMRGLSLTLLTDAPTSSAPSAADSLRCRNCGASFALGPQHACYECFGPLEVGYDHDALARLTRAEVESGPASIWRYAGLLPVGQDPAERVTLDPGLTPLVRADRLARSWACARCGSRTTAPTRRTPSRTGSCRSR
jgi:hypothetical protein